MCQYKTFASDFRVLNVAGRKIMHDKSEGLHQWDSRSGKRYKKIDDEKSNKM